MRKVLAVVVALMSIAIPSASAHSNLVKSNPAQGEIVSAMPSTISFEFSENLMLVADKEVNSIELKYPNGGAVQLGSISVIQNSVSADVNTSDPQLVNGDYSMSYSVVSADGHRITGSSTFTLDNPDTPMPVPTLYGEEEGEEGEFGEEFSMPHISSRVVIATGTLVILLVLAIAYRRFSDK